MFNFFLVALAFVIYALWQLKAIICFFILLLLGGCNAMETTCHYDAYGDHYCTKTYYFDSTPQPSTVYVVEEKEAEDTIIYIENITHHSNGEGMSAYHWSYQCGDLAYWTSPYIYDPWYCYHYQDHHVECDWEVGQGIEEYCFETWAWDDYHCEWVYMFSYCEEG
jgi:hypothetical protein|tara:strand:+ start:353 stop:847 length:495 start_codon:yes stop_codon:yes gene_type:complete